MMIMTMTTTMTTMTTMMDGSEGAVNMVQKSKESCGLFQKKKLKRGGGSYLYIYVEEKRRLISLFVYP